MLTHSGVAVLGNDIHLPGLFHSLNVSIGMIAAVSTEISISVSSIPIPINPIGFLKNCSRI